MSIDAFNKNNALGRTANITHAKHALHCITHAF